MAQTSLGTVYLYEAAADDLRAYGLQTAMSAANRVRWLLPRVGSLANAQPLTDDSAAALDEPELEKLAEQYVGSPENQRRAQRVRHDARLKRGASESAIAFLDRLLRMPVIAEEAMPRAEIAPPGRGGRWLSWGVAALVMGMLLSGLAALFSYRAYERELAMKAESERWRADVKAQLDRQADESGARLAALQAQNQELRQRVGRLEARPTPSPDRTPDRGARAEKGVKPRTRTHR